MGSRYDDLFDAPRAPSRKRKKSPDSLLEFSVLFAWAMVLLGTAVFLVGIGMTIGVLVHNGTAAGFGSGMGMAVIGGLIAFAGYRMCGLEDRLAEHPAWVRPAFGLYVVAASGIILYLVLVVSPQRARERAAEHQEKQKQDRIERQEKQKEEKIRNAPKEPTPAEKRDAAIARLKESSTIAITAGIEYLKTVPPDERRGDVTQACLAILKTQSHHAVVEGTLQLLATWGDASAADGVLAYLPGAPSGAQSQAVRTLVAFNDPRAVGPIAALLGRGSPVREEAAAALRHFGPAAEPAVLPLLGNSIVTTRSAACQVLRDVGTEKSLEPLQNLVKSDVSIIVRGDAKAAHAAILARLNGKR